MSQGWKGKQHSKKKPKGASAAEMSLDHNEPLPGPSGVNFSEIHNSDDVDDDTRTAILLEEIKLMEIEIAGKYTIQNVRINNSFLF